MEDRTIDCPEEVTTLIERILGSSSFYNTLGIESDFTSGSGLCKKKVKENFVRMARTIHPDKCKAEKAQLAFSKLRTAYEAVNSDLNNPKPMAPQPLPSGKDNKQRRQIAVQTSRMLRASSMDTGLEAGGGGDLSALKRYCESSSRPKFTSPDLTSSAKTNAMENKFGIGDDVKRMRFSSAPLNIRVAAISEEEPMAFSSATTPVDIYQQLSPEPQPSTEAENKTTAAEKLAGRGGSGLDAVEQCYPGQSGHSKWSRSPDTAQCQNEDKMDRIYTVDLGKLSPPYVPSTQSTPDVSPSSCGSGRVYDLLSRCHITPVSGADTDRGMPNMCPADLSI